ncbi:hypothetical protein ACFLS5_01575 [Candidatus Bipolaricaulota bacterium]
MAADEYLVSPSQMFCAYIRDGELVIEYGSSPGTTLQFTYRSEKHKSNSLLIFTLATRCTCARCEELWPHPGDAIYSCFELDEVKKYTSCTWWPWFGLAESDHAWEITTFGRDNCCSEALTAQLRTLPPYRVRRLWYGDHSERAGLVTLSDSGVLQIHSTTSPSSPAIAAFGEVQTIESVSFDSDEDYGSSAEAVQHHQTSSNSYVFVNATAEPLTITREQVSKVEITEATKFETKKVFEIDTEATITIKKPGVVWSGSVELSVGVKRKTEQKFEEEHEEVTGQENGLATDFEVESYHVNTLTVLETVYSWTVPINGKFTVRFEGGPSVTVDGTIEMEFTANTVSAFLEEEHILEFAEVSRNRVTIQNNVTPEMTQHMSGAGVVHLAEWRLVVFCHCRGDEAPRMGWIYPRHEEFVGYYELSEVSGKRTLGPGETLEFDLDPAVCADCADGSPSQGVYVVLNDPQDYVYLYTFLPID